MNWETIAGSKIVADIGLALFHSVWQITLVSLALFIALIVARGARANVRYAVSIGALVLAFTLPVVTLISLSQTPDSAVMSRIVPDEGSAPIELELRTSGGDQRSPMGDRVVATRERITAVSASLRRSFPSALPIAVSVWLIGVALFAFRLLGGFREIRRYKTFATSHPGVAWENRFNALCLRLRVVKNVRLLCSDIVPTPIAFGLFKPLILVPASAFMQMSPRELETIIAHELIHIRRYDPLINLVQNAIETVLFYHPGIWWISKQVRREREFATDAAVLEIFENSRIAYANALASLEEIRHLTKNTTPSIVTAANGGNLMQRISKILQKNTEKAGASSAWPAGLALVLISAVITASLSFNATKPVNAQSNAGDRKLAIGFVSIPPLDRTANPPKDSAATAKILIETLKSHKIPAIGFVQGSMISDGQKLYPVRAEIVKMWRDEGFEIGVGGYKHIGFYDTPYDEYIANAEKNLEVVGPILAQKDKKARYFSYPFLNTGRSADERDRFESWLGNHGLTPVKYTVDNQEWMYSYAYDMARNDNDIPTMTEIRVAFIKYMNEMFDHYEKYSQEMFGRDIAQTMVLTPSRLVADSAHDLFGMIEKRGYRFVAMDEALADPAFQTKEDWTGKAGISWFERWRMKQGKPLLPEPGVDQIVESAWKAKSAKK
ncbi:MAG TPA: M56 family metallopeptidase [Pyrinomonadaceae bacterium]|nr:M56 family metallopeptidase [Pyrinomonadaceae bacterium]